MSEITTHSPADVVRTHIINEGVANDTTGEQTWPIYLNHIPDATRASLVIYDREGIRERRPLAPGQKTLVRPGLQVLVRCKDLDGGRAKIKEVSDLFDAVNRTSVVNSGTTYRLHMISRRGDILNAGRDPEKYWSLSLNATIVIEEL